MHERKSESERERHVRSHGWRHVEGCCGRHGVPTIWAFVVCGVLLQRTYCLKWAVPWCRVLCSVCCLVGFHNKKKKKKMQGGAIRWRGEGGEGTSGRAPSVRSMGVSKRGAAASTSDIGGGR